MNLKKAVSCAAAVCLTAACVGMGMPVNTAKYGTGTTSAVSSSNDVRNVYMLEGQPSNNVGTHEYSMWSKPVTSYVHEISGGGFERVEYISSSKTVLVESYDKSCKLVSTKKITSELSLFGGFFSGKDYNYLVFGNNNSAENVSTEVMRVVKYKKNWERVKDQKIYGWNTTSPFKGGSLRMTEYGGKLYVHTCHEMYKSSDGYNHQANMTFVINEDSMAVEQSFYNVMNINYGYVSHSFNQFIRTDGTNLYRVDHGDAYPRSVVITSAKLGGNITSVKANADALKIGGNTGDNTTNVTVGGFELSSNNCIIAGTTGDQSKFGSDAGKKQNVFVAVTDKDLKSTKLIMLTNYGTSSTTKVGTPQLTKISDNKFLLMWTEYAGSSKTTKLVTLDGSGNKTSSVYHAPVEMTGCQPIVGSDGYVKWYAAKNDRPVLYNIDPNDLAGITLFTGGDIDGDKKVSAYDASLVLTEYTNLAKGKSTFSSKMKKSADIDKNGKIGADDASNILTYYTYIASGGTNYDIFDWAARL